MTGEERRGRSKGNNPFKRKDVDMSTNPTPRCLLSKLMGIEFCSKDSSCWLWGKNGKCLLGTLVLKATIFLSRQVPDKERSDKHGGNRLYKKTQ